MGTIVISLLLAAGLWLGQHKTLQHQQDQGPPACQGSGCGLAGGGGGAF